LTSALIVAASQATRPAPNTTATSTPEQNTPNHRTNLSCSWIPLRAFSIEPRRFSASSRNSAGSFAILTPISVGLIASPFSESRRGAPCLQAWGGIAALLLSIERFLL
jgi:hypothetical protein